MAQILKRKRPYPTHPLTDFCHFFRAVRLHFVYRGNHSKKRHHPPTENSIFPRHINFKTNKLPLANSLKGLMFLPAVNFLQMNLRRFSTCEGIA
jgi:hypothetical protein